MALVIMKYLKRVQCRSEMGQRIDSLRSKFASHYQEKMLLGAPLPSKVFMPSVLEALPFVFICRIYPFEDVVGVIGSANGARNGCCSAVQKRNQDQELWDAKGVALPREDAVGGSVTKKSLHAIGVGGVAKVQETGLMQSWCHFFNCVGPGENRNDSRNFIAQDRGHRKEPGLVFFYEEWQWPSNLDINIQKLTLDLRNIGKLRILKHLAISMMEAKMDKYKAKFFAM